MAHLYWRVFVTATHGNDFAAVGEIKFYNSSGTSLTGSGTAIASSSLGSFPASNAFDGNLSTSWVSANQITGGATAWIGYQFSSAVDVAAMVLWDRDVGDSTQWPTAFKVQYSDDGSTWTDATGTFNPVWLSSMQAAYGFAVSTPSSGFYLNWRLRTTTVNGGPTQVVAIAELSLATSIGGSSIASSAVYQEADSVTSSFVAANAFDGNTSTFWASNTLSAWVGCVFSTPQKIVQITITPRQDGNWTNQSPTQVYLEGSNDGQNWTIAASYTLTWPNNSPQTPGSGGTAQPFVFWIM